MKRLHLAEARELIARMAAVLHQADASTETAAMRVLLHAGFRGGDIVALLGEALYEAQLLRVSVAVA